MKSIIELIFATVILVIKTSMIVVWIAGFVLAKGFWSTLFCFVPFWAYYLVIEKLMIFYNFV